MTSKIYTAEDFYKLQKNGKILKKTEINEKLHYDKRNNRYYVIYHSRKNNKPVLLKIYLKPNDLVHSRGKDKGVAIYNKDLDKFKTDVRLTTDKNKWKANMNEYDLYNHPDNL